MSVSAPFRPPALQLRGNSADPVPSLGALMMQPNVYWPPCILDRPVVELKTASKQIAVIACPDTATEILLDRKGDYARSRLLNRFFRSSFGENLLDNKEGTWQNLRPELARPMTAGNALAHLSSVRSACSDMLERWSFLPPNAPLALRRNARVLAFDGMWRSLFAREGWSHKSDPRVLAAGERLDRAHHAGFLSYVAETRALAQWVIARSLREPGTLPNGIASNPPGLNTTSIFLDAGHDNVTSTLVWALWLIAQSPDIQENIRREWRAAADKPFDHAEVPLINATVRETLRLYPPVLQTLRDSKTTSTWADKTFGPSTLVAIATYAMHRSNLWWDKPEIFAPERFLHAQKDSGKAGRWVPFSKGARACIGTSLAQLELVNFIGMIVDRFELRPNSATSLQCKVEWILRPEGDTSIFIEPAA